MDVTELLRAVDATPHAYAKAERALAGLSWEPARSCEIAVLASFTADLLRPYIVVEAARLGVRAEVAVGPFNQFEQTVLDGDGFLRRKRFAIAVAAFRLEDVAPRLAYDVLHLDSKQLDQELQALDARIDNLLTLFRQAEVGQVFVANFAPPELPVAGLADPSLKLSHAAILERANTCMARAVSRHAGCHVLDVARAAADLGLSRWYDRRLWLTARSPWSVAGQIAFARTVARHARAALVTPCKVLALDLDGTLWGGVLGEDGLDGIQLGEEYPGSAFKAFHRGILALRDRGVLLAIASKNNEAEALDALTRHPDSLLRPEHFAAIQIHWNDKAGSLRDIARALNLGVDAVAFFDDNPVERDFVRSQLPMVHVIDVPASPIDYPAALASSVAFDQLSLSKEDTQRAELYRVEQQRQALMDQTTSVDEFLAALDMRVTVGTIGPESMTRVVQLLSKTNQFNLTTRRHGAADLERMFQNGGIGLWTRVVDRFGDNGVVGVAIAVPDGSTQWRVDSFLLSCRVIARRVEVAVLAVLSELVRDQGGTELVGEFIPTAKNAVCADFYPSLGFAPLPSLDQTRRWSISLADAPIARPSIMSVEVVDAPARR